MGALGSALVAFRSGSRVDVLVARQDIPVGQVVTRADFTTARVAADSGLTVDADAISNFVGTHAASTIPQGTLVNGSMFLAGEVVPKGAQVVGVVVDVTRRTTTRPVAGDVVRLIYVSGAGGRARREPLAGRHGRRGRTRRRHRVRQRLRAAPACPCWSRDDDAGQVADLASTGILAVTVLPADTEPAVDLVTE